MKNILKFFVVVGIAAALTACSPSLHPFYTEKDVVFNEALLGVWMEDPDGGICQFTKSGDNFYEFLIVGEKPERYEARLFELGGATYLDLYPKPLGNEIDLYPENFVPAHSLLRVTIAKDSISIAIMDSSWLEKLSDQYQLDLKHERINDNLIALTATTRELQAFVLKHANDKEAFGDPTVLHRIHSGK